MTLEMPDGIGASAGATARLGADGMGGKLDLVHSGWVPAEVPAGPRPAVFSAYSDRGGSQYFSKVVYQIEENVLGMHQCDRGVRRRRPVGRTLVHVDRPVI